MSESKPERVYGGTLEQCQEFVRANRFSSMLNEMEIRGTEKEAEVWARIELPKQHPSSPPSGSGEAMVNAVEHLAKITDNVATLPVSRMAQYIEAKRVDNPKPPNPLPPQNS